MYSVAEIITEIAMQVYISTHPEYYTHPVLFLNCAINYEFDQFITNLL